MSNKNERKSKTNFESYNKCKICMQVTNCMRSINDDVFLTDAYRNIKIIDMFESLQINLCDERSQFCLHCIEELKAAYSFKLKCEPLFTNQFFLTEHTMKKKHNQQKKKQNPTKNLCLSSSNTVTECNASFDRDKSNNNLSLLNESFNFSKSNDKLDTPNNSNAIQISSITDIKSTSLNQCLADFESILNSIDAVVETDAASTPPDCTKPDISQICFSDSVNYDSLGKNGIDTEIITMKKELNTNDIIEEICDLDFIKTFGISNNDITQENFNKMNNFNFSEELSDSLNLISTNESQIYTASKSNEANILNEYLNNFNGNQNMTTLNEKLADNLTDFNLNTKSTTYLSTKIKKVEYDRMILSLTENLYQYSQSLTSQNELKKIEEAKYTNTFFKVLSKKKKGKLMCFICYKLFPTRKTLAIHVQGHKKGKFRCNICSKLFMDKFFIKNHTIHNNKFDFTCIECKGHLHNSNGFKHICRGTKKTAGKYECHLCKKAFRSQKDLRNHILYYHKHKTFRYLCQHCPSSFLIKRLFLAHMKEMHVSNKNPETK